MRWWQQSAPGEWQALPVVGHGVRGWVVQRECTLGQRRLCRPGRAVPPAAVPAALPCNRQEDHLPGWLPTLCRVGIALAAGNHRAAQLAALAAAGSAPAVWVLLALSLVLPWPQAALISAFTSRDADLELLQHLHNLLRLLVALLLFDVPQAGARLVDSQPASQGSAFHARMGEHKLPPGLARPTSCACCDTPTPSTNPVPCCSSLQCFRALQRARARRPAASRSTARLSGQWACLRHWPWDSMPAWVWKGCMPA